MGGLFFLIEICAATWLMIFGFGIDLQTDVDLAAIIELADRLGAALAIIELRIDLVIESGLKSWKAKSTIGSDDVGLYRARMGIRQVDDGIRQRVVAAIQHLACEKTGFFFLRIASEQLDGGGHRGSREGHDQQENESTCDGRFFHDLFPARHLSQTVVTSLNESRY
jgi:hypothetical protein